MTIDGIDNCTRLPALRRSARPRRPARTRSRSPGATARPPRRRSTSTGRSAPAPRPAPSRAVALAVAGSPYNDNTVSGGMTYAYRVTGLDATGDCESGPSSCVQVTATGACTLPPTFAGLASATNNATSSCGITLAWTAATPNCGGPVTYNVYRSTTSGFTPGPANLIAGGVTGTGYTDISLGLVSGTTYYYVVRAVDSSNGVSETNTVERSATVTGPISTHLTETFEGPGGFDNPGWTHTAIAGARTGRSRPLSRRRPRTPGSPPARPRSPTGSWSLRRSCRRRAPRSRSGTPSRSRTRARASTAARSRSRPTAARTWTVLPDAAFTAGGFNGTVSTAHANPIGG